MPRVLDQMHLWLGKSTIQVALISRHECCMMLHPRGMQCTMTIFAHADTWIKRLAYNKQAIDTRRAHTLPRPVHAETWHSGFPDSYGISNQLAY